MKRPWHVSSNRTTTLLLLTVIVLVFAAGLDRVTFHSGYRLDIPDFGPAGSVGGGLEGGHRAFMLVLWSIIAASVFSVVVSMLTPDGRKRLLMSAVFILGAFFLVGVITELLPELEAPSTQADVEEGESGAGGSSAGLPGPQGDAAVERPGPQDAPAGLGYVLAVLLSLIAGLAVYRVTHDYPRGNQPYTEEPDQKELLRTWAIDTRGHLESPDETVDVVQRAYFDLERFAREQLGSRRNQATSAREFVTLLAEYRLPTHALMTLVDLFEQSRYGEKSLPSRDMERARAALRAIVDAVERPGGST